MSEREIDRRARSVWLPPARARQARWRYVLASETCAFDLIHAEFIREVEPGEVVIISEEGIRVRMAVPR
jgi:amidophosphoribosyltransferase